MSFWCPRFRSCCNSVCVMTLKNLSDKIFGEDSTWREKRNVFNVTAIIKMIFQMND